MKQKKEQELQRKMQYKYGKKCKLKLFIGET